MTVASARASLLLDRARHHAAILRTPAAFAVSDHNSGLAARPRIDRAAPALIHQAIDKATPTAKTPAIDTQGTAAAIRHR